MAELDPYLAARAHRGDRSAQELLFSGHAGRVRAYFMRSGFSPADADDLTQDTFVRALRSMASFDAAKGAMSQWLAAIARNVARRQWQKRPQPDGFDAELAGQVLASPDIASERPEAREEMSAIRGCIALLDDDLARLVRMRYVDAMTTRRMAAVTGIPEATVRLRLKEAVAALEDCLRRKGFA